MNKKQQLYCAISGYDAYSAYDSAKDDHFYDLINQNATNNELIAHLDQYACNVLNRALKTDELETVKDALIANIKTDNETDRYYLYYNLETKQTK